MGDTVLSGFQIKNMLGKSHKSNAIDKMFSKYKIGNEEDKTKEVKTDNLELGKVMKQAIDDLFDPTAGMTEEEKQDFLAEMKRKIKNGEKLTADEMQYLRVNDPLEYARMAKVQMQREMLKKQLENCKSKEEAQELYVDAMSRISDDDPTKVETMAAYNNVYDEFRKSDAYEALPATKEEAEEQEDKYTSMLKPDYEEESDSIKGKIYQGIQRDMEVSIGC